MEIRTGTDEHFCLEMTEPSGRGLTEAFRVFPGVYLMYNDFYMESCRSDFAPEGDFWGIEHCRAGKTEWVLENGDCAYLGSESLMSCDYQACGRDFSFPGRLFEGLTLGFEMPQAQKSLPAALGLDLEALEAKISAVGLMDVGGDSQAEAILRLLYAARYQSEQHRQISVIQFLLYLSELEPNRLEPLYIRRRMVNQMKEIEAFLEAHLERRWTLTELSRQFQLPVSVLRRNFTGVFGASVADHMRRIRAEKAKELLLHTEKSISEIASELGYDNASKFSAAFRIYADVSPSVYRYGKLAAEDGDKSEQNGKSE